MEEQTIQDLGFKTVTDAIADLMDSISWLHERVAYMGQPHQLGLVRGDDRAILPTRSTTFSAGFDVYALETIEIRPEMVVTIDTGWLWGDVYPAPGWYWQVLGRSRLGARGLIATLAGVMDNDHRNKFLLALGNVGRETLVIPYGKACAQMVPLFMPRHVEILEIGADKATTTERGKGGIVEITSQAENIDLWRLARMGEGD